ncbi:hypothetical protein BKA83DRAFT_4058090 [Pisolithus microcarpus]|nr:hypothetical protein BKA83DRAFT_4058090 [Pisolithus microcarpus]
MKNINLSDCDPHTHCVRSLFSKKQHLQFSTHEICLRNKAVVPVIVSSAIPHPDMSMHDRELFCHSMLVLFKPWRHFSDLVDSDSCWTERFDNYAFPEHISAIISNFTVEMECKDARNQLSSEIARGKTAPIFNENFETTAEIDIL